MAKLVTLQFEIDDEEYDEFLAQDDVQGNLQEWMFAEICQNQGFGFLVTCRVEPLTGR